MRSRAMHIKRMLQPLSGCVKLRQIGLRAKHRWQHDRKASTRLAEHVFYRLKCMTGELHDRTGYWHFVLPRLTLLPSHQPSITRKPINYVSRIAVFQRLQCMPTLSDCGSYILSPTYQFITKFGCWNNAVYRLSYVTRVYCDKTAGDRIAFAP